MPRIKTVIAFLFFFVLVFLGSYFGSKFLLNKENSTQASAMDTVILNTIDYALEYKNNQDTYIEPSLVEESIVTKDSTSTKTQIDPQGEISLILEQTNNTYKLYTRAESLDEDLTSSSKKELIFSGNKLSNETYSIPHNTWSPDNKYFFIKKDSPKTTEFLLFKATGDAFDQDNKFINITQKFLDKEYPYTQKDITGWASNAYLVVQTNNPQTNQSGYSYWFDVYSHNFLQLSSAF